MRAVLVREFGPTDQVEIGDIDAPLKLGTEVLVDVHAAGMNPIDYKTVIGKGAAKAVEPLLPWVPGGDVAGIVAETGSPVTLGLEGGDPVDAGSALMIMTLGAKQGDQVEVSSDDEQAVDTIAALVEKDLDA